MKLYEIASKYERLIEEYNQSENDEKMELVLEELKRVEDARDEKLNACCIWLRDLEITEEVISKEIALLQQKRFAAERRKEAFQQYLSECLGVGEKWSNGVFSLSWRKSEAVHVIDENKIPAIYMREILKYEANKKQIKEDLKAGATIPGVDLETRHSLQFK